VKVRPPRPEDLDAVYDVIAARQEADTGARDVTVGELRDAWGVSGFDLSTDAQVVEAADQIVAYAEIRAPGGMGYAAPFEEERRAAKLLLDWMEGRERQLRRRQHRQAVMSTNRIGQEVLCDAGYERVRSIFRMIRALDGGAGPVALPEAVELRPLDIEADGRDVHSLDGLSFASDADYVPESFAAFRDEHLHAHDLDPDMSRVAWRGNTLVGFLLARHWTEQNSGFVDVLAVHPWEEGRGIGRALLQSSFAAFAKAGLETAQLGVSSENPRALRLYTRLGMTERFRWDIYQRATADQ